MKPGKILWIITGPTAVGKTDHAINLAKEIHAPILSADSRQIYNELNIGVAKPSTQQLEEVKHYFINHVGIHQDYNAGIFAKESRELINTLFDTHQELVVCGGTGLYINAMLNGLDALPGRDENLRSELEVILKTEGLKPLQDIMRELNPAKFETMDINNPQRLIRAIEIEKSPKKITQNIPVLKHRFEIRTTVIELPREELYERINKRVDHMIEAGLEEESKSFIKLQHLNALQTVGYAEWWPYFKGEENRDAIIDKIKQHTRNYAKRQLTWIRNKSNH